MLVISSYIEKSEIEGLGLFAGQDIEEGDIIWYLDPTIDHVFSKNCYDHLIDTIEYEHVERLEKWCYKRGDDYILCSDNTKFANHSDTPNCRSLGQYDVALRNIKKGEELTYDYRFIDDELKEKRGKIYDTVSERTERETGNTESGEENGETQNQL